MADDDKTEKKPRKRGGVRNHVGRDAYTKCVEWYRENPADHAGASRHAGINYRTARKLYLEGSRGLNEVAIKRMLDEENVRARAIVHEGASEGERKAAEEAAIAEYRAKEKAKLDAAKAKADEIKMVRGNRANVIALTATTGKLLRAMYKSADKLERLIAKGEDVNGKVLTVRQQTVLLNRISLLVERCATAGANVIKNERILAGEPTEIVAHKVDGVGLDEAMNKAREAVAMGERIAARRERSLKLIQGGKPS